MIFSHNYFNYDHVSGRTRRTLIFVSNREFTLHISQRVAHEILGTVNMHNEKHSQRVENVSRPLLDFDKMIILKVFLIFYRHKMNNKMDFKHYS